MALSGVVALSTGIRRFQFVNPTTGAFVEGKNNDLVAMIQAPFSAKVGDRATFTVAPTIAFFPDSSALFLFRPPVANPGSFGTMFGLAGSASFELLPRVTLWGDAFVPFTGNNSISPSTGLPRKEIAFNAGVRLLLNPRLALNAFATNTQGSLGPLGLTTQPGSVGFGGSLVFMPDFVPNNRKIADNFAGDLKQADTPLAMGGFGYIDGGTVPKDQFLFNVRGGSQGLFSSLRLGLVKDFDLGIFLGYTLGKVDESDQGLSVKARLLNQDKGALLTASVAATVSQTNEPFLNFFNNNASAFSASGRSKTVPFLATQDDDRVGRLFIVTLSLPLHYKLNPKASVWFTPILGYVQRDGLQEAGFNAGVSYSILRDVSLIAEVGADFVGKGNSFSGNRLVTEIPYTFGVRWNPSRLFGIDPEKTKTQLNVELFVTNRVGSTPWQQLRVREGNDPAIGVGLGFLF